MNVDSLNLTMNSTLDLPPGQEYPVFVLGTLTYMTILLCNTLVFATIVFTKSLHKPMFLLLLNLPLMDMIGATAFLPQFVTSILTKNRSISYPGCFFQAFLLHFYGTGNLLFLTLMAYDRYIAICLPLRYNSIMIPKTIMTLVIAIWFAEILFFIVLFSLIARFRICKTNIVDIFCSNPAMRKLLCVDTKVYNYFGLFFTGVIQGIPLVINKQPDARGKALQTCGTHLVVFLFFQFICIIALMAHRFERVSPNIRRALGVSVIVFPPVLNPLIYGLNTKELQINMIKIIKRARLTKK
uniref:Olfactory receptor n=1 Tax=Gadus morhua TaxID=8049 RepID=A0A8C4ZTH5_GADMO